MRRLTELGCPRVVPWEFIAERDSECRRYHNQTPERLAERGGLAPILAEVPGYRWESTFGSVLLGAGSMPRGRHVFSVFLQVAGIDVADVF